MLKTINLPYPPRWINAYVYHKLAEYEDVGVDLTQNFIPIFASSPTNIEDIYQNVIQATGLNEPLVMQYDRMIQARQNPFYPHKKDQLLYYVYSTSLANANNAGIIISQILDRADAAAQDVNAWCAKNPQYVDGVQIPYNVFFRTIKVHQVDEARSVMNSTSARTIYASKFVIEYDYHARDGSTYR